MNVDNQHKKSRNLYQIKIVYSFLAVGIHDGGVLGVTAFFAFVATVAYGVDSYLKFQDYRSSNQNTETAQEKTDPYQMEIPV